MIDRIAPGKVRRQRCRMLDKGRSAGVAAETAHHRAAPLVVFPMADLAADRIPGPGFVVEGAPTRRVGLVELGG